MVSSRHWNCVCKHPMFATQMVDDAVEGRCGAVGRWTRVEKPLSRVNLPRSSAHKIWRVSRSHDQKQRPGSLRHWPMTGHV